MNKCKNELCKNSFIKEIYNILDNNPNELLCNNLYKHFFHFAIGWLSYKDNGFIKLYERFFINRKLWDKKTS